MLQEARAGRKKKDKKCQQDILPSINFREEGVVLIRPVSAIKLGHVNFLPGFPSEGLSIHAPELKRVRVRECGILEHGHGP